MHALDLSPLNRFTVGFDRVGRLLQAAPSAESRHGFPAYDIEKLGEDRYRIAIALAGYGIDDLEISAQNTTLTVSGKAGQTDAGEYLHRGIARRAFVRRFELADTVSVEGARLENGLLQIDLVNQVPEAQKLRRIEIAANDGNGAAEAA